MTAFNAMLAADAGAVFLQEFAETVTYTPVTPTTANPVRTLQAVVWRDPPAPLRGGLAASNWTPPQMIIRVGNSAGAVNGAGGIDPALLDTGGDTITVAYRLGQNPQAYRIHLPDAGTETMDPGMLTLELR
jgi:hypothetical protein